MGWLAETDTCCIQSRYVKCIDFRITFSIRDSYFYRNPKIAILILNQQPDLKIKDLYFGIEQLNACICMKQICRKSMPSSECSMRLSQPTHVHKRSVNWLFCLFTAFFPLLAIKFIFLHILILFTFPSYRTMIRYN